MQLSCYRDDSFLMLHFQEKKQKLENKRRKEEEARREKDNMYNSPLRNHGVPSDEDMPMVNGDTTLSSTLASPRRHLLSSELLGDRGDRSMLPPVPKSRSMEAYGSTYGSPYQRANLQNGTSDLTFNATHAAASVSRLEPLESGGTLVCQDYGLWLDECLLCSIYYYCHKVKSLANYYWQV